MLGVGISRERKNLSTAAELLSKEAYDGGLRQNTESWSDLGVEPKIWETPQIMNFHRVFHYKPSILGYHYFWKHPFKNRQSLEIV